MFISFKIRCSSNSVPVLFRNWFLKKCAESGAGVPAEIRDFRSFPSSVLSAAKIASKPAALLADKMWRLEGREQFEQTFYIFRRPPNFR